MNILQPNLENEKVLLVPLKESDFDDLYKVASDKEIWKQHPNAYRYQKEEFKNFFKGAMSSKGAFLIFDKKSGEIAGSTRFYDYNEAEKSIFIGYTFFAKKFWGTRLNSITKSIMLNYIFQFVDVVKFHVGESNFRSRIAMERLGATYIKELPVAYFGEESKVNVEYHIEKSDWEKSFFSKKYLNTD